MIVLSCLLVEKMDENADFFLSSLVLESKVFRDIHIVKTDSIQKPGNASGNVTIGNVRVAL